MHIDGVRVFSATLARERDQIGEWITDWVAANQDQIEIVDKAVMQSSDARYHCVSVVVFYRFRAPPSP